MRAIHSLLLAALLASMLAIPAWAHAHLVKADPPVGGAVSATDTLRLEFSEGVEIKFSGVAVTKDDGTDIAPLKVERDAKDAKALVVTLPAKLDAGTYKVRWHVVSVDTHRTQGDYAFTVKP